MSKVLIALDYTISQELKKMINLRSWEITLSLIFNWLWNDQKRMDIGQWQNSKFKISLFSRLKIDKKMFDVKSVLSLSRDKFQFFKIFFWPFSSTPVTKCQNFWSTLKTLFLNENLNDWNQEIQILIVKKTYFS